MSLAGSHLEVDLASYALAHDPDVASKWKGGVIRREASTAWIAGMSSSNADDISGAATSGLAAESSSRASGTTGWAAPS